MNMKETRYWVVQDSTGNFLKWEGKIMFFAKPEEAIRYIERRCNSSPYLKVRLWQTGSLVEPKTI